MATKISNARKKELEQPDPFLEFLYHWLDRANAYRKQLIWAGCALLAVIVIASGTVYTIRSSDSKASALLASALKTDEGQTAKEGFAAARPALETLTTSYPNTSAGRMGRIHFAKMAYDAGEFETAKSLYQDALAEFGDDPVLGNTLHLALGHTCRMLGQAGEAETHFKAVADGSSDYMKDEALFNLGLLAEEKGEGADTYFSRIVSDYADSIYVEMARSRMIEKPS